MAEKLELQEGFNPVVNFGIVLARCAEGTVQKFTTGLTFQTGRAKLSVRFACSVFTK